MTTTRTFTNRLTRSLRDRMVSLVDTRRPEGPLFLAAAVGTEVAKATGFGPLEKACKPLIVPAALAIALREGRNAPAGGPGTGTGALGPVDTALLAVTAAGYTTGDVILMLGGGHASRSMTRLVSGAGAFAVGHVALGTLMLRSGIRPKPVQVGVHGAVAAAASAILLAEDRANAPLAAYGTLLGALSALATSVEAGAGRDATVLAAAGPVFLLSDSLILARRKTTGGTPLARALDVAVIDTYALAALLLLTGTAAAARTRRTP